MKKYLILLCIIASALVLPASAAPIGWYELSAVWRDGNFVGKFYYDSNSPYRITKIEGSLADRAQTTAIDSVWNVDQQQPEAWTFVSNTVSAEPGGHDAGFYLHLLDQGKTLSLDTSADNALFDWSSNYAYYSPDLLDGSPLLSFSIREASPVPEPATLFLFLIAVAAFMGRRACRPARKPSRLVSISLTTS